MSVSPVSGAGVTPFQPLTLTSPGVDGAAQPAATSPSAFASSLDAISGDLATSDTAAANVATGTGDIATMTTAMTKASVDIQLTVALRDRAVQAYQQIMQMQV